MSDGIVRLFTYQRHFPRRHGLLYSSGVSGDRIQKKFYGGVLTHDGRGDNRVYRKSASIGDEMKLLAPRARRAPGCCPKRAFSQPRKRVVAASGIAGPNRYFNHREHIQLFYNALHDP